jgi:hypothetical protein
MPAPKIKNIKLKMYLNDVKHQLHELLTIMAFSLAKSAPDVMERLRTLRDALILDSHTTLTDIAGTDGSSICSVKDNHFSCLLAEFAFSVAAYRRIIETDTMPDEKEQENLNLQIKRLRFIQQAGLNEFRVRGDKEAGYTLVHISKLVEGLL